MPPLAYLDETGLHVPDYPAVLQYLQNKMKAIYGDDLYLEPDSQDGQMLAVFALSLYDTYSLAGSVYNAYSPQTAQAVSLSRAVLINGLRRKTATHSTVPLRIVGAVGEVLKGAIAKDASEQRWILPPVVTIPISGEILLTATAENVGDVRAAPGEVNKIATPMRGWHSVTNPDAATPGATIETDADLRRRQSISTALPSRTVFEGIVGAVTSLPGVTRCRGYENDQSVTDENGIPGHTLCLVVEGGDVNEIAQTIALKKTPGPGTFGDTAIGTADKYGMPIIIKFFRPTVIEVGVTIRIKPLPGYLASTGDQIKKNVLADINALQIGEDVLLSKLLTPINKADQISPRTFDAKHIEIGIAGQPGAPVNLAVPFNAVAVSDLAWIDVEIVP